MLADADLETVTVVLGTASTTGYRETRQFLANPGDHDSGVIETVETVVIRTGSLPGLAMDAVISVGGVAHSVIGYDPNGDGAGDKKVTVITLGMP